MYYTLKGEEWRIPATKLIWQAAEKTGWNEHFERLDGMLFGYEDWQNDWWIETISRERGWGGSALCCTVTAEGLAWIEAAGFRALPPNDKPTMVIMSYNADADQDMHAFMLESPDSVALVRFNVPHHVVTNLMAPRLGPRRQFPTDRLPELNRGLAGTIVVVARRTDQS